MLEFQKSNRHFELKNDSSILTPADMIAHQIIKEELTKLTPDIPIVSEEGNYEANTQCTESFWLVDPLDGTKEYFNGHLEFTINIALIEQKIPTMGWILCPYNDELFLGGKSFGSFRVCPSGNLTAIRPTDLLPPIVLTSRSHINIGTMNYINRFYPELHVRKLGSSLKFVELATGTASTYPRLERTREWDIAAGQAILEGVGGEVKDLMGNSISYGKPQWTNGYFVATASCNF